MRQKKGFIMRDVCGDKVIVGEGLEAVDFGRMVCLNETAAWLWEEAERQGDFTVGSLAEALCEEFDVEQDRAEGDVAAVLGKWQDRGMIEP